jgi:cobalt-zinc-cadmium efflux system outer membrane protein
MKHLAILCGGLLAVPGFSQSETPLILEQALMLARNSSPALRAARLNINAAERAVGAAGLWSNPVLGVEAEGLGGDLDLYRDAEYSIGIKQEFQLGGKQRKDRTLAEQLIGVYEASSDEAMMALETEVRLAFAELLAQQEISKVRDQQMELARAFVEVARRRLDVGAGSELEKVQADLALEETTLAQTCCFGDVAAARANLASLLGIPTDPFPQLAGSYYETEDFQRLHVGNSHPTLRRLDAEAARIGAEAERARAQDTADLMLGAGFRHEAAGDIDTFVLSASIPLSFNRRGRAEQAAGLIRADAIRAARAETLRRLQQELDTLHERHKGAVMEVNLTRDNLLPKAEQAYAISREGYEAGRFSWLELISAQQHLAEIRIRYIESLLAVHRIEAELAKF